MKQWIWMIKMKTVILKYINLLNLTITLIILCFGMLYSIPSFAEGCKPSKCPTTCSAGSMNSNGKLDANCIVNKNNNIEGGSCFNNVPITSADSVSSSGTNIAVSGTNPAYVKAAAKGKVVYAGVSKDGAGRIVVIEHEKSCEDSNYGSSNKYHTIYSHLLSYNVKTGDYVNMNDIIGIAGGSTSTSSGAICDNDSQSTTMPADKAKELPSVGFSKSGCGNGINPVDVHLAFEVYDGPALGTKATASSALNSNCDEIQNFCGSCSSDTATCLSENPAEYHEAVSSSTSASYYNKNARASTTKAACETGLLLDAESCLFCDMFKSIFNTASIIAKAANEGLATPTKSLVGIGFLIWLAIFVLRNVSSFGQTNISEILKTLLFQGFRVTIVMLILGGAIYQVIDLTINPILQTGLSFARTVVADGQSTCSADAEYLQGIAGYDSNKGYQKTSDGGLSKQLGISYICSIKKLEDSVSKLISYGNHSNCLALKDFPMLGFIPHMGFLTTGVFLYAVGAVLLIMFPWFLIDCLLQLCIVVALLPCAIGAFAFKSTANYLKKLWSFFMNSMFNFVFISIIIFIITANFKTWLGYDFDSNEIDPNIFINATGNGLAWWGTTAFRILGVCFFCYIFLSEAKGMADKFASAPTLGRGKGIGTMFGGLAANAGFSMGKSGLGVAAKGGQAMMGSLEESASSFIGGKLESTSNHAKSAFLGLIGGQKITDANGNVIGNRKSFKLLGKEYAFENSKDDKGVWSSHTTKGNSETIDDTILRANITKNADGNVIGITTNAKTVSSKYLINEDKTINQHAINTLMSGTGQKEHAARHIVSEVMKDRGMQLDSKFLSSETKINNDGSFTIVQKNEDGKIQTINASIDKTTGIMTIKSDIADGSGNITSTISDGITPKQQTTSVAPAKTTGPMDNLTAHRANSSANTLNNNSSAVNSVVTETPQSRAQGTKTPNESQTEGVNVSRIYDDLRGASTSTLNKLSKEDWKIIKENSSYSDMYQDKYGNKISVHRSANGNVTRIDAVTADGKIYQANKTEFNEERLEALIRKLQNSPQNLNDVSKDLIKEHQEYQKWEQSGKPALKAEQGSLIQKIKKDSERYSYETLIDSNGSRMIIERREGEITEITISSLDGERTTVNTNQQNRAQMQEELEGYVSRLKNSPNDLSIIKSEIKGKYSAE